MLILPLFVHIPIKNDAILLLRGLSAPEPGHRNLLGNYHRAYVDCKEEGANGI